MHLELKPYPKDKGNKEISRRKFRRELLNFDKSYLLSSVQYQSNDALAFHIF